MEKRAFFRLCAAAVRSERQWIDLSNLVSIDHALKARTRTPMIAGGSTPPLPPIDEAGSDQVRERKKAFMAGSSEAEQPGSTVS